MCAARREPAPTAPPSDIARRREERRNATGRRSDSRWTQILAGATAVFSRLGYANSTLEDVAAEVGVRRATLYYYVATKEELLVSLLAGPIRDLRTNLDTIAAEPLPARAKLTTALMEYTRVMGTHPELTIFNQENVHRVMSGPAADELIDDADRYGDVLTEVVRQGVAAGELRDDVDPRVAVMGLLGMFNWVHRWFDPAGRLSLDEVARGFITMALDGLATRP
jgi:TetR/AcrR family transcriptional regulator, cholesterol catabolism regulator